MKNSPEHGNKLLRWFWSKGPALTFFFLVLIVLGMCSKIKTEQEQLKAEKLASMINERPPVNVVVLEVTPRPIEDKIREFGALPDVRFTAEEVEQIRQIGDNTGCMMLKGASNRHQTSERPDEWPMRPELLELAERHGLGQEW